ncbi:LysR family transcriptional regulator [Alteromonas sp. CYL-A6]|uniref:LysR family transcriptional regulator n=1 Tax=Alteromonas nitratireducens TaxID=3390813 RepID=UPI0034A9DB10
MRTHDLNLLMIFDAIMTEGAITRAADRLAMTQPAVSNALSRMRTAWNDELFVKDGRGIQPTTYARNLWSQIQGPLSQLENAVSPGDFDPATAQRTFRVAAPDGIVSMVWGPLRQHIEREAPGINVYAIPNTNIDSDQVLKDAEAELAFTKQSVPDPVIRSEAILSPPYVVVMRQGHPLAKQSLSLEDFISADHLLVSVSGDVTGPTDQVLANMGLTRRVAMTVNSFHNVPELVKTSDLICVAPSITLEREIFTGELAVYESPVDIVTSPLSIIWHKRQDHDPGLNWLRQLIVGFIKERSRQHDERLSVCCRKGYCENTVRQFMEKQGKAAQTVPAIAANEWQ